MDLSAALPGWLQTLLAASCSGSLLALVVLTALPLLRHGMPARWRMALWLLVLIRFIPLPLPESRWSLFNWLPHAHPVAQAPAVPAPIAAPDPSPSLIAPRPPIMTSIVLPQSPITSTPPAAAPAPDPAQPPASPRPLMVSAAYLLGCVAVLARLLLATRSLRRILRRAIPATAPDLTSLLNSARHTLRISRHIPLLLSDDLTSPALVGFFRPRLLLPRTVLQRLKPDELRLVFLHECAHLRRRDVLLNYALSLLSIAHWFNPLVWLLLPRLRAERELACDELVLLHTADPTPYGHTLLKLLESAAAPPPRAPASVGIIESRSVFSRRIRMVANYRKTPRWLHITIATTLIAFAGAILTGPLTRRSPAQPADAAVPAAPPAAPPAAEKTTADLTEDAIRHANDQQNRRLDGLAQVLKQQQAQVDTLELNLRDYRRTHGLPAVLPMSSVAVATLQQMTLDLAKAQANAATASAAFESLKKQVQDGTPLRLTADLQQYVDHGGPIFSLQGTRSQLEQDKAAARAVSGDKSPQIAMIDVRLSTVDAQIADARKQLEGEARVMLMQRVESDAHTAQVVYESLRDQYGKQAAELRDMDAALAPYQSMLDDLKTQRDLYQKLQSEYRQAQLQSMTYSEPQFTQVYDVRDLVGIAPAQTSPLTTDQRATGDDLVKTISRVAGSDKVSVFNGTLIISAGPATHRQIAQLLAQLRDQERSRHQPSAPK